MWRRFVANKKSSCFRKAPAKFIENAIKCFVSQSRKNRLSLIDNTPIFDEPLVAFARGDDPIFLQYKEIIGHFHLTPRETLQQSLDGPVAGDLSVIAWVLPITRRTRLSNRRMKSHPSLRWAHTRWDGERFNKSLRRYVVSLLRDRGYRAVAPFVEPSFKICRLPNGYSSNWSERHIAYVAGLGTFSLSDGLITPKGIAMRCGSVVAEIALTPSPRVYASHTANCPFLKDGTCGVCIERCPAEAITPEGHDKNLCWSYQDKIRSPFQQKYKVTDIGCGLCQTSVPCEWRIPRSASITINRRTSREESRMGEES